MPSRKGTAALTSNITASLACAGTSVRGTIPQVSVVPFFIEHYIHEAFTFSIEHYICVDAVLSSMQVSKRTAQ